MSEKEKKPERFDAAMVEAVEYNEFTARWPDAVYPIRGDAVLPLIGSPEALQVVADALEQAGYCDSANVLPGVGIHLEE